MLFFSISIPHPPTFREEPKWKSQKLLMRQALRDRCLTHEEAKGQKKPGSDLLSRIAAVPSARGRFTSVFGMGTGVAALLWPPGDHLGACAPDDPFRKPER